MCDTLKLFQATTGPTFFFLMKAEVYLHSLVILQARTSSLELTVPQGAVNPASRKDGCFGCSIATEAALQAQNRTPWAALQCDEMYVVAALSTSCVFWAPYRQQHMCWQNPPAWLCL